MYESVRIIILNQVLTVIHVNLIVPLKKESLTRHKVPFLPRLGTAYTSALGLERSRAISIFKTQNQMYSYIYGVRQTLLSRAIDASALKSLPINTY